MTDRERFYSFYQDLDRRIDKAWLPPQGVYKTARVSFDLDQRGNVSGLQLAKSSGSDPFDKAALAAIEKAAPFLPLAEGMQKPKTKITHTLTNSIEIAQQRERANYLNTVQTAVIQKWLPPQVEHAQVSISFHIESTGKLTKWKTESSSQNIPYNEASMLAIKAAAPFLPPPSVFPNRTVDLYLTFGAGAVSGHADLSQLETAPQFLDLPEIRKP